MKLRVPLVLLLISGALSAAEPTYDWRTHAGNERGPGTADGYSPHARLNECGGALRDRYGNLYVADTGSHTIRKVAPDGVVTTFAGRPGDPGSNDGPALEARFFRPRSIAVNAVGEFFVADTGNHTIRRISASGEVITWGGTAGVPGCRDGDGHEACFNSPSSIFIDEAGNGFIADTGNHTVRRLSCYGCAGVVTVAGSPGVPGYADGEGGTARFNNPVAVTMDQFGMVYIADRGNHTVRTMTRTGTVSTLAGMPGVSGHMDGVGSEVRFGELAGIAWSDGWGIFVSDSQYHTIRRVWQLGGVTTMAGGVGLAGYQDGPGAQARFNLPLGLAADRDGNVYISESGNSALRKMNGTAQVITLVGGPRQSGNHDGSASAARFQRPAGIVQDAAGNLFVADYENHTIRKVAPDGTVSTFAGSPGQPGSSDGTGSEARFKGPWGVAMDLAENLYVTDSLNHTIRKITPTGTVTTLAGTPGVAGSRDGRDGSGQFFAPRGIFSDNIGNLHVADFGNHTIRRISTGRVVSTVAGTAGVAGFQNGQGAAALFDSPAGIVQSQGFFFVTDQGNCLIRKMTNAFAVSTFAGIPGSPGGEDGDTGVARFTGPEGIGLDIAGDLIITDSGNHTIRKITQSGAVSTLGGTSGTGLIEDGVGSAARFCAPAGIALPPDGSIFIADAGNHRILRGLNIFAPPAIDTTGPWNRISRGFVRVFGNTRTETYGQTFVVPPERRLRRITFHIVDEDSSPPAFLDFKVRVMAWEGQRATGPVLFETDWLRTTNNHGAGGLEQFDIATGDLNLTPGGKYVFFLSTTGSDVSNLSTGAVGLLNWHDYYPAGEFVSLSSDQDPSRWTTEAWTSQNNGLDLAFRLEFSNQALQVRDGATATTPELHNNQAAAVDFGTIRQKSPATRSFRITNGGASPVRISQVNLPGGFTHFEPSNLPLILNAGESEVIRITLAAVNTGDYSGIVTLGSEAEPEPLFRFPVSGRVVAPDIALHDGGPDAPVIESGGTITVWYGDGVPAVRTLTLANYGTAPLALSFIHLSGPISQPPARPPGYNVSGSTSGTVIAPGEFILLQITPREGSTGVTTNVIIFSDDPDESALRFTIRGAPVYPEIEVRETSTLLTDGQTTPVDFGRTLQGTPVLRDFTVTNSGPANLQIISLFVPPGYEVLPSSALPVTVGSGQSAGFQLRLAATSAGTFRGNVRINNNDPDEGAFDFPVTGEVFIPDPVATVPSDVTTLLNRQTGLREQTIRLTNDTTATVPAYNLIIRGLPDGVEVNNASERRPDGSWVVYVRQAMNPLSTQDILLEYFSANRGPGEIAPQLSTEVVLNPPDLSVPGDAGFAIDRVLLQQGGAVLIEFPTTPGRQYQVQFSNDGTNWQASLPAIRAAANRTQWLDRGLPRTDSHPSAHASRFYRVAELAP